MKLPRFSLRELFLLVVIAAMGCGWWREHRRVETALQKVEAERQIILKALDARRERFVWESEGFKRELLESAERLAEAKEEARQYRMMVDQYRMDELAKIKGGPITRPGPVPIRTTEE